MPLRFARLRRGAVATVVAAVSATTVFSAPASAANPYADEGSSAAQWLGGELSSGRINSQYKDSQGNPYPDWGLTVDTGFVLAADGSQPRRLGRLTQAVRNHYDDYVNGYGATSAGAAAKVLVFTRVIGANPRDFGGHNVRRELLALEVQSGPQAGRLSDRGAADYSNTLTQSLGVIGLARSGRIPPDVVGFLLKQQCTGGYFRTYIRGGTSCTDGHPSVDATAYAVQALLVASRTGTAVPDVRIERAVRWLRSVQHDNGSFAENGGVRGASTNSTGLAAQALQATGHPRARAKAASYVASVQITRARAGDGPARSDVGALALNRPALREALRDGVTETTRDTFRRATAQGYFALVPRWLGMLRAR